jgi:tRNA-2-methylthio-N6-dimethylallyladenosine synthase
LPKLLSDAIPTEVEESKREISRQARNDNLREYLSVKPVYESSFRAYVPISTGCDNFCTYCAVPYTRGREKSRSEKEILTEVRDLVKRGFKEITLLGQNVNSYGQDIKNATFVQLIKKIDKIPGDFRVYFYSNHPKDMSDILIDTLSKLKHFPRYIHLPLQSGNDVILKKMNRHYTQKQYLELVSKIKKAMPNVTLTTDIIVGFPGETEKEFADTIDVMEKAGYDMAFLAQYSPRPETVAAKLPDNVSKAEKVRREKILQQLLAKTVLENNKKLVGETVQVLIDEEKPARTTDGNGKLYGRTEGYKVVEIPKGTVPFEKQSLKIGQFVNIKITKSGSWKLIGVT